jgi:hypothetical protein
MFDALTWSDDRCQTHPSIANVHSYVGTVKKFLKPQRGLTLLVDKRHRVVEKFIAK